MKGDNLRFGSEPKTGLPKLSEPVSAEESDLGSSFSHLERDASCHYHKKGFTELGYLRRTQDEPLGL